MIDDGDGPPVKTVEDYQAEGRANIAGHVSRYLRGLGIGSERVERWSDAQWLEAAKGAGITSAVQRNKVPSKATRAETLRWMRDHEEATA